MANNIYDYSYQMRRNLQKKISFILLFIFCIFIVVSITSSFFIYSTFVKSDSMSPSLEKNNLIFVSPFVSPANPIFSDGNILERGQVVQLKPLQSQNISVVKTFLDKIVLFFTLQKIAPFSDSKNMTNSSLIRRVVGLPGDTVYVKDYIVYIKPANSSHFLTEFEVSDKKYDIIASNTTDSFDGNIDLLKNSQEIILDKDEYFVMSDNRVSSIDSRLWGKIKGNQINGKVLIRYFPLNKISVY